MEEPLRLLEQARELAYQTNNAYLLNMITPTFGFIYLLMGKFEMAFEASQTGYRLSLATKNERWRLSGLFGMVTPLCLLNRDMDLVTRYLQDVPPEGALIYQDSLVMSLRMFAMMSYTAKIGDDAALYKELVIFMNSWGRLGPLVQFVLLVPLLAYWLGKHKNPETAVQWLGFSEHYQQSSIFVLYFNEWDVIVNFRESLRAELGDEKFDSLWESGKLLDANTLHKQVTDAYVVT